MTTVRDASKVLRRAGTTLGFTKGWKFIQKLAKVISGVHYHDKSPACDVVAKYYQARIWDPAILPSPKPKAWKSHQALKRPEVAKNWRELSQAFYASREWRELRYEALRLHGGACQLCGRSRKEGIILHVDHIQPRWTHPELSLKLSNLQVLCEDCNLGKSAKYPDDWR